MTAIPWDAIGRSALLVLTVGFVIVIVWMRSQGLTQRCPSCGERLRVRTSACPSCGATLR